MSGEHGKYARPLAPCGSDAAYHRHLRHKETPCQPCKEAHWVALREWYQRSPRNRAKEPEVPTPALDEFDWQRRAACKGADPEQFFAGRGVSRDTVHTALTYCARCPVMTQCGAMADRHRWIGLWGMAWRSQNGDWRNKDGYHVEPIPSVHAELDAAVGRHPSARKGRAA